MSYLWGGRNVISHAAGKEKHRALRMQWGDTFSRCSCQGLEHRIIMTNFHIRGGSGCLSPRCFLLLTPVRPHCEQKYHYALTSRRSPSLSGIFVLTWMSIDMIISQTFGSSDGKVCKGISVVFIVISKIHFSHIHSLPRIIYGMFAKTLSCQDLRVQACVLYDTRRAGAWCDHLLRPLRVSVGCQSSEDLQSSLDPLPSAHLRGWHPKTRGWGEAAIKAAGNELTLAELRTCVRPCGCYCLYSLQFNPDQ